MSMSNEHSKNKKHIVVEEQRKLLAIHSTALRRAALLWLWVSRSQHISTMHP